MLAYFPRRLLSYQFFSSEQQSPAAARRLLSQGQRLAAVFTALSLGFLSEPNLSPGTVIKRESLEREVWLWSLSSSPCLSIVGKSFPSARKAIEMKRRT